MKSRKWFLMVAFAMIALVVAACSNAEGEASSAGDEGGDNGGGAIELTQSETVEAEEFGGSITVNYPEGWGVSAEAGAIFLSNNPELLEEVGSAGPETVPSGTVALGVFVLPGEMLGLVLGGEEATPVAVLEFFRDNFASDGADDSPEFGDVEEVTLDGKPAARVTGTSESGDAVIYAIDNGGNFSVGFGTTATGELGDFDDVIKAVIGSTTFTASE